MGQTVSGGQATGITDGIRLSDWYYKYIREIKHMRSNTLVHICEINTVSVISGHDENAVVTDCAIPDSWRITCVYKTYQQRT